MLKRNDPTLLEDYEFYKCLNWNCKKQIIKAYELKIEETIIKRIWTLFKQKLNVKHLFMAVNKQLISEINYCIEQY